MKKKYKRSQFNYVCNSKTGHIIYNTLYNSLTRLSEDEYRIYLSEDSENEQVLNQLISQGIWVNEEANELEQYNLYTRYAARCLNHKPNITVTPSMECNAKCFYCYEEGVKYGAMRKEDCTRMIRFLNTLDCSQGIDLTWFGGEPLMNQEWMDYFSECLDKSGINFTAFMITNGSKIQDDIIDKMVHKWKIKNIQITLDGCFEEYALRKAYIDQDETIYYKILRTIGKLARANITVLIRMNIDRNNRDSILNAVADIAELYKNNNRIKCYPAFLSGSEKPLFESEKIEFIKRMIDVSQGKFNANEYLYRLPRAMACYYNQPNAFSIDTKGNIFICEHMLGHEKQAIGNIKKEFKNYTRELSGKRTDCQKCVFLPKCQGGCMDALEYGETPCFTDKYIIKAYLDLL